MDPFKLGPSIVIGAELPPKAMKREEPGERAEQAVMEGPVGGCLHQACAWEHRTNRQGPFLAGTNTRGEL